MTEISKWPTGLDNLPTELLVSIAEQLDKNNAVDRQALSQLRLVSKRCNDDVLSTAGKKLTVYTIAYNPGPDQSAQYGLRGRRPHPNDLEEGPVPLTGPISVPAPLTIAGSATASTAVIDTTENGMVGLLKKVLSDGACAADIDTLVVTCRCDFIGKERTDSVIRTLSNVELCQALNFVKELSHSVVFQGLARWPDPCARSRGTTAEDVAKEREKHWQTALKRGSPDAVVALVLCLLPKLRYLKIRDWPFANKRLSKAGLENSDKNFTTMVLRGCANSQNLLNRKPSQDADATRYILPMLSEVGIGGATRRPYGSSTTTYGLEEEDIFPLLLPKNVNKATINGQWAQWALHLRGRAFKASLSLETLILTHTQCKVAGIHCIAITPPT